MSEIAAYAELKIMTSPSTSFSSRISIPKHVLVRLFPHEAVLLNLETESYHGLDEVGTRMWQVLAGSATLQEAFDSLQSQYEVDPDTLRRDLAEFVEDLARRGLVELGDGAAA